MKHKRMPDEGKILPDSVKKRHPEGTSPHQVHFAHQLPPAGEALIKLGETKCLKKIWAVWHRT